MSKEAMKLALEAAYLAGFNASGEGYNAEYPFGDHSKNPEEDAAWIKDRDNALQKALAEQPAQDNTYGYAKYLAEAMFKRHFASDEHYASGRVVWGVNDTVIGILTQIDNMVADMVRRPAQQEPVAWLDPWTRNNVTTDYDAYGKHGIPLYTSPPASKPLTRKQLADAWIGTAHITHATERQIAYARAVEAAHGIKGDA